MTASRGIYAKRGAPLADRLKFHSRPVGNCVEWTGYRNSLGYGVLRVVGRTLLAHRVSYEVHVHAPGGLRVCHRCDNPACIRPDHLFLGTDLDNTRDMIAKGRMRKAHGEQHLSAKLSPSAVRKIRTATPGYGYAKKLAAHFSVSTSAIKHARKGKTWKHIK